MNARIFARTQNKEIPFPVPDLDRETVATVREQEEGFCFVGHDMAKKPFADFRWRNLEYDGWEDLISQLEKYLMEEIRGVLGLENWIPPRPVQGKTDITNLTDAQHAVFDLEKVFFVELAGFVKAVPCNEKTGGSVIGLVSTMRDIIARSYNHQAYSTFVEEYGRHATAMLLSEERAKNRHPRKAEDSELTRLRTAMECHPGRGKGGVNWKATGKQLGISDVGAKKKADKLGLISKQTNRRSTQT